MIGHDVGGMSAIIERLASAGCIAAAEEAAEFVAAAPDHAALHDWLSRREQGEPVAWITGTTRFCGRTVFVAPGVYVPRVRTEELARRAAALLAPAGRALDLCCGAGAIAAHLQSEVPTALVIAVDADPASVVCARRNGVVAVVGDMAEPLVGSGRFDVVTAVAPYVPTGELQFLPADVQRYEPTFALDGGTDGLDLVRRVVGAASRLLRSGGWLLVEVGAHHDLLLTPALDAAGFEQVTPWWDEEGDLRGVAALRR